MDSKDEPYTDHHLVEWAHSYNGYERLASAPARLGKLIQPARSSYKAHARVPDWCGVDLLRGWAFFLVRADRHAGGGTLADEWRDVLAALTDHPSAAADDRPPNHEPEPAASRPSSSFSTEPKLHKDPLFLKEKQARLRERHVAPINHLVERIAQERDAVVPYVDPDSGGVRARVLLILESPGRAAAVGSGMVSVDNNDETAKNLWNSFADSGLSRTSGLLWNAVPWCVGDGTKLSTPTTEDVAAGRQYLLDLLELMPHVRVVLAMGKHAQAAVLSADQAMADRGVALVECPHAGPIPAGVTKGKSLTQVHAAFETARTIACPNDAQTKGPHV